LGGGGGGGGGGSRRATTGEGDARGGASRCASGSSSDSLGLLLDDNLGVLDDLGGLLRSLGLSLSGSSVSGATLAESGESGVLLLDLGGLGLGVSLKAVDLTADAERLVGLLTGGVLDGEKGVERLVASGEKVCDLLCGVAAEVFVDDELVHGGCS
jgi:hypothetical protein